MKRASRHWLALASVVATLTLWELASQQGWVRPAFFPPPSNLARAMVKLFGDGELWPHLRDTLVRLGWTFCLASLPGLVVGLLMGISREVRHALDPVLTVLYPIPAPLFFPILGLVLGRGEAAVIVTSSITAFIIIAVSTMAAVRGLDRAILEAGVNFGARGWRLLTRVLLPAALPGAFTGMRVGLGMSMIVLVAVEMVGADTGLGHLLWFSWSILQVEVTYVALFWVAVLGLLATYGLDFLGRLAMPWREELMARKRGVLQ